MKGDIQGSYAEMFVLKLEITDYLLSFHIILSNEQILVKSLVFF